MIKELYQEGKANEYLIIEVKYDLGGLNYYSGQIETRGLRVHFNRKTIKGNCESCKPQQGDNFRIFVKELKRKNAKQLEIVKAFVYANKVRIIELYYTDRNKLVYFLKDYR